MRSQFSQFVIDPIISNFYKRPYLNSFCINEEIFSYKQFGECISKIRVALQEIKSNEKQIALIANDDIETYASIFALWLEGKCYVPLHPTQPLGRCMDIVEQIGAILILDSSEETRYSKDVVLKTKALHYERNCLDYRDNFSDDELAYILFTSGSTGKPKGVMITRGNIGAFMDSFWKTGIELAEKDRCLQCFDLTFDVSVQSYLVALVRGACVYTVPNGQIKYVYVSGLIDRHKLTFGAMAPSMLRYLKPYFDEIDAASMKISILTAEACPLSLAEDWYKCAINTEIYDFYGPTEATIYCTYYKLTKGGENKSLNGIVSIGKPMAMLEAIIIDENNNIVTDSIKGELCIAGGQITKGYWNNQQRNDEYFFEKELNGKRLRFYHTGDLCYKEPDGNILYSGRLDHQVKVQGFRIELSEIEFHTREILEGKNAVAIAFENEINLTEIALFIESEPFSTDEIVTYLHSKMPSYMMPAKLIFVPVFPLNANDKIDRIELKERIRNE